jgi:hypothetical protein
VSGGPNSFVVHVDDVPVTRSTLLEVQKLAKVLGLSEEAAIGYAAECYMTEHGERRLRIEAARKAGRT